MRMPRNGFWQEREELDKAELIVPESLAFKSQHIYSPGRASSGNQGGLQWGKANGQHRGGLGWLREPGKVTGTSYLPWTWAPGSRTV